MSEDHPRYDGNSPYPPNDLHSGRSEPLRPNQGWTEETSEPPQLPQRPVSINGVPQYPSAQYAQGAQYGHQYSNYDAHRVSMPMPMGYPDPSQGHSSSYHTHAPPPPPPPPMHGYDGPANMGAHYPGPNGRQPPVMIMPVPYPLGQQQHHQPYRQQPYPPPLNQGSGPPLPPRQYQPGYPPSSPALPGPQPYQDQPGSPYSPRFEPAPSSPYPPNHPGAPYPPPHSTPHSQPSSPYPPSLSTNSQPSSPLVHHTEPTPASPYPPAHQYPPSSSERVDAYPSPMPQPAPPPPPSYPPFGVNVPKAYMPMPVRYPSQRRHPPPQFAQLPVYPPPGYFRPPEQDFINRYRSSTVQPSAAAAAEELHRTSMRRPNVRDKRKSIRTYDSDSDSDDDENQATVHEDASLINKPLPPPPSPTRDETTFSLAAAPAPPAHTLQEELVSVQLATKDDTMDIHRLSGLTRQFVESVKSLQGVRELSVLNNRKHSFTGQEAVAIIREILQDAYPDKYCATVAEALMFCKPRGVFQVVESSQRTRSAKAFVSTADEIYALDDLYISGKWVPLGVITSLTPCYVYGCQPGAGGCYAPRCPNKLDVFIQDIEARPDLTRTISLRSSLIDMDGMHTSETWGQQIAPEVYETIEQHERDRQEAMNEIVYTEEQYQRDLDILHEVIVTPLMEANVLDEAQLSLFIGSVFSNYKELLDLSTELCHDLFARQDEHTGEQVPGIADILVKHFSRFRNPFAAYVPNVHLAEYIVADEMRKNAKFRAFLQNVESDSRLKKQSFRHYLLRPVMRVQRYPLLLHALIKKTDKDSEEHTALEHCDSIIGETAAVCDQLSDSIRNRVEILKLNDALTCRQGEYYDLKLTDPSRKVYFRGNLKRENSTLEVSEKHVHAVLLDHMLLLTKPRQTSQGTEYRIWRRPIPLQMLFVPQSKSNDFNLPRPRLQSNSSTLSAYNNLRTSATMRHSSLAGNSLSLTIINPGRHGGEYHFVCSSYDEKRRWLDAIQEARARLKQQGETEAFELQSMEASYFREGSTSLLDGHGRVNCSIPFATLDGTNMLAVGTTTGVYIKALEEKQRMRSVLSLKYVTQLAVMEKQRVLLVLADKTLQAYPLDELISTKNVKAPDRLMEEVADHVQFFQLGVCNDMEMLVYARLKPVSTNFIVLTPRDEEGGHHHERRLRRHSFFRHHENKSGRFHKHKEFTVGARATQIHFLRARLAIVCDRGFEIINLNDLSSGRSIPYQDDPEFEFLTQRSDDLKPLAMFRVQNKFLLCYNKFAFFVNNHNQSLVPRDSTSSLVCEWECHPEDIVFQYPYVIAFDQQFIEIRHIITGDLVQIIPGNDCRLTCVEGSTIQGCIVHANRPAFQDIFQLVPRKSIEETK